MLKAKLLPLALQQACNNGVKSALLLTQEGSIVAVGGADQSKTSVVSAIVANTWTSYEKSGGELSVLLIECEQGKVAVAKVSKLLVCAFGDGTVELGILRTKVQALVAGLQEPLKQVTM